MRKPLAILAIAAALSLAAFVGTAFAVTLTNSGNSNGNHVEARLLTTTQGVAKCAGKNSANTSQDRILVSYVCQKLDNAGVFQDIGTAPATDCNNCTQAPSSGAWTDAQTTVDICARFGRGSWRIRAQAGGFRVNLGTQYNYSGAVETAATTITCR